MRYKVKVKANINVNGIVDAEVVQAEVERALIDAARNSNVRIGKLEVEVEER